MCTFELGPHYKVGRGRIIRAGRPIDEAVAVGIDAEQIAVRAREPARRKDQRMSREQRGRGRK